jgi:hypothetical protein
MREEGIFPKAKAQDAVKEVINLSIPKGITCVPKKAELGIFEIVKERQGTRADPMKDSEIHFPESLSCVAGE